MNRNRGFTFLEILIAIAVLGAAFTVLLTAHASAIRHEGSARRLMEATLLARQILTETEVNDPPPVGTDAGDFGETFPDYTWERQVDSTEFPKLRQVTIRVLWPSGRGPGATELLYYTVVEGEP